MLWGLLAVAGWWLWRKRRDGYFGETMVRIFRAPSAMAASVVLLFFLTVAVLDSLHLRTAAFSASGAEETVSLLDMTTSHLRNYSERTYSAPFALHEYTRSVTFVDGKAQQRYEPLRYVDGCCFWFKSLAGLGAGWLAAWLLVRWHRRRRGRSALPWESAYRTLYALFMLFGWLYVMSFSYHVLGTDKVGGDLFYAALKSVRTGVLIGTLSTLVTLPLALTLGMAAGYFRGWVDDAVQYLYTTLSSIPGVLLIAAGVLSMELVMQAHPQTFASNLERADMRLLFLVFILGVTSWTGLCRMVRAETLKISRLDYITAARTFGLGGWKMMWRHILPNLSHIVLISIVLDFSSLVLAEAVLSYVGVGVDPTMYSWGNMINQARLEMAREPMVWWSLFAAFVFMFALVLSANIFADRVQYVLDPRNEGEW